uniref:Uncharacterized protein n=1 Tax=Timema shepardi TaxID=629360 RepID=A0A7R9G7J1_TIMSH|nr:unnamed protein product [Timema shepardi]
MLKVRTLLNPLLRLRFLSSEKQRRASAFKIPKHEFHDRLVHTEFYDEVKTDKAMKGASTSQFNDVI